MNNKYNEIANNPLNREFKRMEDFWKNPKADEDENEYFCAYYFDLIDEAINLNEKCSVVIYEQTVDIECE